MCLYSLNVNICESLYIFKFFKVFWVFILGNVNKNLFNNNNNKIKVNKML